MRAVIVSLLEIIGCAGREEGERREGVSGRRRRLEGREGGVQ